MDGCGDGHTSDGRGAPYRVWSGGALPPKSEGGGAPPEESSTVRTPGTRKPSSGGSRSCGFGLDGWSAAKLEAGVVRRLRLVTMGLCR